MIGPAAGHLWTLNERVSEGITGLAMLLDSHGVGSLIGEIDAVWQQQFGKWLVRVPLPDDLGSFPCCSEVFKTLHRGRA